MIISKQLCFQFSKSINSHQIVKLITYLLTKKKHQINLQKFFYFYVSIFFYCHHKSIFF